MPKKLITATCVRCGIEFTALRRLSAKQYFCSYPCSVSPLEVRFWEKVKTTEVCWLWTGRLDKNGYGDIRDEERRRIRAHRVSWELHFGPIPAELCVLHKCDNPACVRPDHLFLGTPADNMKDMAQKGRSTFGERQPKAKLVEADVLEIRALAAQGVSRASIAKQFLIAVSHVARIVNRDVWSRI
jgi:hypothetical protein